MTKAELVKEISNRVSMSQKDVASVIDVLPEVFKDTVAKDEKINLVGFMTVSKKHIPAKSGETCLGGVEKPWTTEPKDEVSIKLSKSYKTI
jgi:nucleoid DNA-binding protein